MEFSTTRFLLLSSRSWNILEILCQGQGQRVISSSNEGRRFKSISTSTTKFPSLSTYRHPSLSRSRQNQNQFSGIRIRNRTWNLEMSSPRSGSTDSSSPTSGSPTKAEDKGKSPEGSKKKPPVSPIGLAGILTWTEYVVQNELKAKAEDVSPRDDKGSPRPREGDEGQSPRSPRSDKDKGQDENKYAVDTEINGKVSLWRGDITKLEIDAIVNAANKYLERGGGVCGCIHEAAGDELQDECDTLEGCPEGSSKLTRGYALPAKHVIHTVGPMGEKPEMLRSAYNSALKLMLEKNFKAIAFPCISTGIYGYPADRAAIVAMSTVREFLEKHKDKVDRIIFATFLPKDVKIYEEGMQFYFPTE